MYGLARWSSGVVVLLAILLCATASASAADDDLLARAAPQSRVLHVLDEADRVPLAGNVHPLTRSAQDAGRAGDSLRLERLILVLKPDARQTEALSEYLGQAHDPVHPRHARWLQPTAFGQHFGAAQTDIERISAWLTGHGFTIDDIPAGRRSIIFSGTAAQVRASFHTEMRHYTVNGKRHLANATDPHIPRALSAVVEGVVSLHDFHSKPSHVRAQVTADFTSGGAHYMGAADFHTIYNVTPLHTSGITGSGRAIAVLGRSNVVLADMQAFRSTMNLPANVPQIIINGSDPGLVSGDHGESDLDLQWSGAVAPGAAIKFVTSASTVSTDGIALSALYAVNNNVADVISLSYGLCESSMGSAAVSFYDGLWQQAAALGITVLVSSGDSGAAGCDSASATTATHGLGVNGLCTSPYSTCVGGTQFADTANPALYWSPGNGPGLKSALSYIPEVVWNESGSNGGSGLWATGGGASIHFTKPSWQTTPGVPAQDKRFVPDVSLTAASHDGYLVYSSDNATHTQTLYVFGGTSASTPSFAGIIALIAQKTGYRQGNVNPRLYGLATRQASNGAPAYFHLVTSGNNSVPGRSGFAASVTTPYFNQATGLGSVDANVLASQWTDLLPVSSTVLTAAPNPSISGQSVVLTATVTGAAPTGNVQFKDGAADVGAPVTLSGGVATLTLGSLAPGAHNMSAAYSGDPANQASVSVPLTQTILNATTVALSAAPAVIAAGQSVLFVATVNGVSPTGTVQFKDGAANLGPAVALVAASASLSTNQLLITGLHNITAAYSGDTSNAASVSPVLVEQVTRAPSVTTVSVPVTAITVGDSMTLTANVTGVVPSGSVQFFNGGNNLGAAVPLTGGIAILTTTTLPAGALSITAAYSGDSNNLASVSSAITLTVNAQTSHNLDNADVPTLPEWALLVLGALLLLIGSRAPMKIKQMPPARTPDITE